MPAWQTRVSISNELTNAVRQHTEKQLFDQDVATCIDFAFNVPRG